MLTLDSVKALLEDDIAANNDFIVSELDSDVDLINQVNQHIITGGKRLRPLFLMLVARALGYDGHKHCKAAAIIEFIHTATLLHDDVVDQSALRRGKKTVNYLFGNPASVLTGDFLYSRAFQMMVDLDEVPVMRILADATNVIAKGEILQLLNCNNPKITEKQYMEVIYCKTAKLFEAACDISAILARATESNKMAVHHYGIHLGNAFQIADDVLDYVSDADTMGKNVGDDLAEGKVTLPIIYALDRVNKSDRVLIEKAITEEKCAEIGTILNLVKSSGAIKASTQKAESEANLARNSIDILPASIYKDALISLCDLVVNRAM